MSNSGFPISVWDRAREESRVYQDAYQAALVKLLGSEENGHRLSTDTVNGRANLIARAAVKNYRAWLVSEGYTDLNETYTP